MFREIIEDCPVIADYVAKSPLDLPADFEIMITDAGNREAELCQLKICKHQAECFYQNVMEKKNTSSD